MDAVVHHRKLRFGLAHVDAVLAIVDARHHRTFREPLAHPCRQGRHAPAHFGRELRLVTRLDAGGNPEFRCTASSERGRLDHSAAVTMVHALDRTTNRRLLFMGRFPRQQSDWGERPNSMHFLHHHGCGHRDPRGGAPSGRMVPLAQALR